MSKATTAPEADTDGDAALAASLQNSEFELSYAQRIPPDLMASAPFVSAPVVGGRDQHQQQQQYVVWAVPPPAAQGHQAGEAFPGVQMLAPHEEKLMETFALGRALRVLAILDGAILFLNCIFIPVLFLFLIFPISGYLAGTRYSLGWTYAYMVYYTARLSMDLAYMCLGYWWFVLIFIINLIIARYILRFATLLYNCSDAEVLQLQNPTAVWANAPPSILGIV